MKPTREEVIQAWEQNIRSMFATARGAQERNHTCEECELTGATLLELVDHNDAIHPDTIFEYKGTFQTGSGERY